MFAPLSGVVGVLMPKGFALVVGVSVAGEPEVTLPSEPGTGAAGVNG